MTEGIAEWRGYRVGKATRRGYDMPEGADYLTGVVRLEFAKSSSMKNPAGWAMPAGPTGVVPVVTEVFCHTKVPPALPVGSFFMAHETDGFCP